MQPEEQEKNYLDLQVSKGITNTWDWRFDDEI